MTQNMRKVLRIVQAYPEGVTALEVHKATRISFHSVSSALRKLREAWKVAGRGGIWRLAKIN